VKLPFAPVTAMMHSARRGRKTLDVSEAAEAVSASYVSSSDLCIQSWLDSSYLERPRTEAG